MVAEPIKIDGLKQFSKDLRTLDNELPKALRLANNEAADLVVAAARPRVPTRTGRARKSVKAKSTRTAVRVQGGGKRAPYYPWLDFGGKVGKGLSVERRFWKDGRYLYRSYYKLRDSGEFEETLTQALLRVASQAGVEVD